MDARQCPSRAAHRARRYRTRMKSRAPMTGHPSTRRLFRGPSCLRRLADDPHFRLEIDARSRADGVAHVVDQRFDIRCARLTLGIDDEVRVLFGDARAADRVSLESAGFDEARCMIAGRIAKYAAGIRRAERLCRDALREQLLDSSTCGC